MNLVDLWIVMVSMCFAVHVLAQDAATGGRRDETIVRADALFGQHYIAATKTHPRFYDKQTETGPPDEVIYRHGASYVIELIFAPDGAIARLALLPEAALRTDNWSEVPDTAKVSQSEMQWLVASANALQHLGKVRRVRKAPEGCFQSGQNLYCTDIYELATVSHYHVQRSRDQMKKHLKTSFRRMW